MNGMGDRFKRVDTNGRSEIRALNVLCSLGGIRADPNRVWFCHCVS